MSYEYPDHLCVTPGHTHVYKDGLWHTGWCKTCKKATPIGWEQPKPLGLRPLRGRETAIRTGERVGVPTRKLHRSGIDDTPCKRAPWLWDRQDGESSKVIAERRKAAKQGCESCPFLKACRAYAQEARLHLEPYSVISGMVVNDSYGLCPIDDDGKVIYPKKESAA